MWLGLTVVQESDRSSTCAFTDVAYLVFITRCRLSSNSSVRPVIHRTRGLSR